MPKFRTALSRWVKKQYCKIAHETSFVYTIELKKSFEQTNKFALVLLITLILAEWGWINSERVGQTHIKNFLGSVSGIVQLKDVRCDLTMHAGTQLLKSPSMIRCDQCLALDTRLPSLWEHLPSTNVSWVSIVDSILERICLFFTLLQKPTLYHRHSGFPLSP